MVHYHTTLLYLHIVSLKQSLGHQKSDNETIDSLMMKDIDRTIETRAIRSPIKHDRIHIKRKSQTRAVWSDLVVYHFI